MKTETVPSKEPQTQQHAERSETNASAPFSPARSLRARHAEGFPAVNLQSQPLKCRGSHQKGRLEAADATKAGQKG